MRKPAQRIGDAGPTLELATEACYIARNVKAVPHWTIRGTDPELIKVEGNDGPDDEKVVRRYSVDPKSGRID